MTIEMKHVTKMYGRKAALQDVSLRFEAGKIYGMLGANGSGKSTSLKLISGLAKPDKGEVTINGKLVTRQSAADVSYMTELDFYYNPFTIGDAIDFQASQFKDFNRDRAAEMLAFMDLEEGLKIRTLSKGNRGRVRLVLALARQAPIILLDEPFSGLDQLVRESIVKSLLSFIDFDKQTVIITTHEIDEIETLLDEVVVIQNGNLIAHENVENIREDQGRSVVEWLKYVLRKEA